MFRHEFLTPVKLPRETVDGRRYYISPNGSRLPSVTTILKEHFKKDFSAWKKRVGVAEADAITYRAASRGTSLHNLAERYMKNEPDYLKNVRPTVLADFLGVQPLLEKNVSAVLGIEFPLYSERLRTAGTADLICTWGNTPTVVDFKTSRKPKQEKWITDYFIQAAVYGQMVNELYGIDVSQIVIILIVENDRPVVFRKESAEYQKKIEEIFITERAL